MIRAADVVQESEGGLLERLAARDRAMFGRWSLSVHGCGVRSLSRLIWVAITHCGGVTVSVAAVLIPLALAGGALHAAAARGAIGLAVSHLIVQIIKRSVARQRPSRVTQHTALIAEPPCSSFPSGHATAAMSVAFAYAVAFPGNAIPLLSFAAVVGFSRVRLGVHFPSDVIAGQTIAVLTDLLVLLWR